MRAFDVKTGKIRWSFHTFRTPASSATTRGPPRRGRWRGRTRGPG
ncbi:MAG: hypothetical protein IPK33_10030 [Gemmatimonadetes bacterium]|nr:hypothetical protein [Gemmatimonadota bacterium]